MERVVRQEFDVTSMAAPESVVRASHPGSARLAAAAVKHHRRVSVTKNRVRANSKSNADETNDSSFAEDDSDCDFPVPSMYSRRNKNQRDLLQTQRMINQVKRKNTLARASIPRAHRHFRHTNQEYVMEPLSKRVKKTAYSNASAPIVSVKRESPDTHSVKHIAALRSAIADLESRVKTMTDTVAVGQIECKRYNERKRLNNNKPGEEAQCFDEQGLWDTKMEAFRADERKLVELRDMLNKAKEREVAFLDNYHHYQSRLWNALRTAKALDDRMEKEREEERRAREEYANRECEWILMGAEDIRAASNGSLYATIDINQGVSGDEMSSPRIAKNGMITDFFGVVKGNIVAKTISFYHKYYHEHVVGSFQTLTPPVFEDTPMYKSAMGIGSPVQMSTKTKKRSKRDSQRPASDSLVCGCSKPEFVLDDKTSESICTNCGVICVGPEKFVQSFEEVQASSTRSTAPYERVSHVSCCNIHAINEHMFGGCIASSLMIMV